MLVFSNRQTTNDAGAGAFTARFTPAEPRLAMARVSASTAGGWQVADLVGAVDDDAALRALVPLFRAERRLLVYLHGFNNTPADSFQRYARLSELYGLEVIGFAWPSEGFLADGSELPLLAPGAEGAEVGGGEMQLGAIAASNRRDSGIQRLIRRYRQAKSNAQDSVDALARLLRLLATARLYANQQPISLAAHSLGAHLLQYTFDLPGAGEALGATHNVALLAACVRAAGHRDWLARLQPKGQVFVTYNRSDSVLFGASIADGQQTKLGTDPGPQRLLSPSVRYVSFSNAKVGAGGHRYFVLDDMPKKSLKLFSRMFGSERDIQPGEFPRRVYPVGCDADGSTCYMAAPDDDEP
jgi:hypothetical protein